MAHRSQIPLGVGPDVRTAYTTAAIARQAARELFLHAVQEHVPEVLKRLRTIAPKRSELTEWARRHNLTAPSGAPAPWVIKQAKATLEEGPKYTKWKNASKPVWFLNGESIKTTRQEARYNDQRLKLNREWHRREERRTGVNLQRSLQEALSLRGSEREARIAELERILAERQRVEPVLLTPGVRSPLESERAFLRRVRREAPKCGWIPAPLAIRRHYEWAAKFQCGGLSVTEIAQQTGVHGRTVTRGVDSVLDEIGLKPRAVNRGRPTAF